jgi:hypothetical protein
MKALFGVASLLLVLAVVGVLASRQLGALRPTPTSSASDSATAAPPANQVEKFRTDVVKALDQGARKDEPQP